MKETSEQGKKVEDNKWWTKAEAERDKAGDHESRCQVHTSKNSLTKLSNSKMAAVEIPLLKVFSQTVSYPQHKTP